MASYKGVGRILCDAEDTREEAEAALAKEGTPSDWTKNKACRDAVLKTFGGES